MDLGDRSRRDRLAETFEQRFDLHPERGLDDGDRRLAAHRRDAVLQALELDGDLRPDDVRAGRKELPQLDVGRTQSVDRPRKAGQAIDVALGDQVGERERQPQHRRQQSRIDADERPLAREHKSRRAPAASRG